ncbi:Phosphoglycerate mutase [Solidesulfovibrio carbinoliphilus subsp. oakridgensis]|uniref:Phosphoglycerate mutase n=1 Tax=Solidesulfovibrio carbinoliphilus subsp. oakridgensis TaxID=694327 RepID=G7QB98_9BACT|nr:histidine phosphatase family protein [Solidesulfovibrio carbinoliphilus]EHJ49321.1 Phosphoglycerate mutase [Solidesulfovibrio carbinoliphilus subsp. oakridgensis]
MPQAVFYLLRHAATLWNLGKRIQGQWDSELAPAGKARAGELAPSLAGLGLARILTSDLGRAKATAGILNLALRLPVTLDRRLREQHFGEWTGRYWRDIPADALAAAEAAGWNFTPPGGESRAEVRQRAEHALVDAARANAGRSVLVVTHQGVIKAVLYHLLGRAFLPDEPPAFDVGRVQQIVCRGGSLSVGALDIVLPDRP